MVICPEGPEFVYGPQSWPGGRLMVWLEADITIPNPPKLSHTLQCGYCILSGTLQCGHRYWWLGIAVRAPLALLVYGPWALMNDWKSLPC